MGTKVFDNNFQYNIINAINPNIVYTNSRLFIIYI